MSEKIDAKKTRKRKMHKEITLSIDPYVAIEYFSKDFELGKTVPPTLDDRTISRSNEVIGVAVGFLATTIQALMRLPVF